MTGRVLFTQLNVNYTMTEKKSYQPGSVNFINVSQKSRTLINKPMLGLINF